MFETGKLFLQVSGEYYNECVWRQVECAINRATKEKRVAELEEALRNSSVAFGVRYNKVSVSPSSGPLQLLLLL